MIYSIDNNRFPFYSVQLSPDFCIPASVSAILGYWDNSTNPYSLQRLQRSLAMQLIVKSPGNKPSFESVEKTLQPEFPELEIKKLDSSSFEEWLKIIIDELKEQRPIAISKKTPDGNNAHILVAISYNEEKEELILFNPGIESQVCKTSQLFKDAGEHSFTFIIMSEVIEYSIADARSDREKENLCPDLLTIKPI